jgi:uncharacterized protein with von Willebrand factor type A (vWA) domain
MSRGDSRGLTPPGAAGHESEGRRDEIVRRGELAVDAPRLAVSFGRALRAAGVPTTSERAARFAHSLSLLAPLNGPRVYWAGRATLVSAHEQIAAYDRVFDAVFGGGADLADARRRPVSRPPESPGRVGEGGGASLVATSDEPGGRRFAVAAASPRERLATKSFEALTAEEIARLRRLRLAPPVRRSRRTRRSAHGRRIDLRATLRRSLRTGGEPVRLARRRRRERPRRLVLLCDISGSMEPHSRAFLTLLQGAVRRQGAEAFVFATRLTRLTRALAGADPDAAVARAAALPPDWSGGTRIASALQAFTDRHGRRGMARGAVVAILSDGWERGDPADLGREMERLARLAHRIVWINPRAVAASFEPLAGGMAAALPYVDELVAGADLDAAVAAVAR